MYYVQMSLLAPSYAVSRLWNEEEVAGWLQWAIAELILVPEYSNYNYKSYKVNSSPSREIVLVLQG